MKEDYQLPLEQKEKLEKLFRLYSKNMVQYAYTFVRERQAAEDIIQETFIKIAGCMEQIDDIESGHTRSFLFKIVKNCSIDYIRKRKKEWKQTCCLDDNIVLLNDTDMLEIICDSESKTILHEKIHKLKKAYQEVMIMKYERELSDEEIAEELGITEENVRIRIYRAKKVLLKDMKREED